jgi:hypothetical protein
MSTYEIMKEKIKEYQKTEKYKSYKKQYSKKYQDENKLYASFRAIKSTYFKKYGEEVGKIMLANYMLKKKLKGIDLELLLSPTNR